ncbi:hypothetical protein ACIQZI_13300 [Peribacillus sp. NPDC096379]|uniref:hypothetical protein n=1 Tax=Peribacillus sp. NPDC096379 TaxID=3364393 RepID=UPI003810256A
MREELFKDLNDEYIKEQAEEFNTYSKYMYYSKLKIRSLVAVVIVLLLAMICKYLKWEILEDNNISKSLKDFGIYDLFELTTFNFEITIFSFYIIIIIVYSSITVFLKNKIIKRINADYTRLPWMTIFRKRNFFWIFISPDYLLANESKDKLVENIEIHEINSNKKPRWFEINEGCRELSNYEWLKIQIERKFLVKWANWLNVFLSSMLFVIIVSGLYFLEIIFKERVFFDKWSAIVWIFIAQLISFRILSRGVEIIIAFYKDVVRVDSKMFYNKWNNKEMDIDQKLDNAIYLNGFRFTILRSQGRLSLAIHTLLEMFILFAAIYIALSINITDFWGKDVTPNLLTPILHSLSIGVFNVSFDPKFNLIQSIFHVAQILLSCVLILLSVSQYLNGETEFNDKKSFEYRFYKALDTVKRKPDDKLKRRFMESNIGVYKIYYGEGIKIKVREKNVHHNYIDKIGLQSCSIKWKRRRFSTRGSLEIQHCKSITMKFVGKDKIYLYLS